jgi:hypothetical protein
MFNLLNTTNLLIISVTFLALSNFVIAVSWIKSIFRNKSLSSQIKDLNYTILSLNSRKLEKLAKFTYTGMYYESEPSVLWNAVVNLRQVAYNPINPNKIKFEIVSIITTSGSTGDVLKSEKTKMSKFFLDDFVDGWIDISKESRFEWVKTISPEEERHQKLLELGLDDN